MPTLASTARSTNFAAGNTNKNVTGLAWNTGDLILVRAITGDNTITATNPPTNANLTFSAVGTVTNTASTTKHYAWAAIAASSQTAQTLTGSYSTATEGGYTVEVWSNHGGIGNVMTNTHATSGAPQASLTFAGASSGASCQVGHWNQATGARTYLTNAGAASEYSYLDDATFGTTMTWTHANAGAAGAKTLGVSAPTGTNWWIVAAEILDAPAAALPPELVMAPRIAR